MLDFLRRVIFGPSDFIPLDKRDIPLDKRDDPYADMDEVWPSWLDDEPDELCRGVPPHRSNTPPTNN